MTWEIAIQLCFASFILGAVAGHRFLPPRKERNRG